MSELQRDQINPLYEDGSVMVWADYEGNGRHVMVENKFTADLSPEPTEKWGEKIRAYARELHPCLAQQSFAV